MKTRFTSSFPRAAMMLLMMLLTSISAWADNVTYIDENGDTQYCSNFTILDNSMNDLAAGWYVVNSDVTYSGDLNTNASGNVNIILCDGKTLTASGISPQGSSDALKIYGQSQGTGTANISGTLDGNYSLTINGGTIKAGELETYQGSVVINGGKVNVGSIASYCNVDLYGGNVIVTGKIDGGGGIIVLGGATVKAGSYSADKFVCISKGLTYYDGTGASYTGTEGSYADLLNLTDTEIAAIGGKTLRTYDYRAGTCGDPNVNEGKNVTWLYNIDTHTLTISGTGAMADFTNSQGQPWFSNKNAITSVVINEGVTTIGKQAFYYHNNLASVSIAASVESIGESAFDWCSALGTVTFVGTSQLKTIGSSAFSNCAMTSIELPATLETIGNSAFDSCKKLESITVDANNANYASEGGVLFNQAKTTLIRYPQGKSGTAYTIPASVTTIVDNAFYGCSIASVTIPASVTSIGEEAFKNCANLATVTFDAGSQLKTIGDDAFYECSIASVTIPASVETIGNCAFDGCSNLATVTFAAGSQLKTIGNGAFGECNNAGFTSITIPASVTSIGENAFNYCSNLATVTVYAPSCSLGEYAFGEYAFDECNSLSHIYVFKDKVEYYKGATNWSDYADIISEIPNSGNCGATGHESDVKYVLTGTSPNYTLTIMKVGTTGAMADYEDANYQPWVANRSDIKFIVIEEGVTSIGNYAFSNFEYVTSPVTIPASVTSIGKYSFYFSTIPSFTFADGSALKTIDSYAFSCYSLSSISLPSSVTSIGSATFDGCTDLTVTLNSNPTIGKVDYQQPFGTDATVTMNLTANGPVDEKYWTTFYNENYSFTVDGNTTIYKGKVNGNSVQLTEVDDIPADNAAILKSTASPIVLTLTTTASGDFTDNDLKGAKADTDASKLAYAYCLTKDQNNVVGFYKYTTGVIPANRAYLIIPGSSSAPGRGFYGFDETTKIESLTPALSKGEGAWYDLQGRKVAKPTKGLYIVNGKKVVIK